jgi:UDP-N-acetyl-D-mannosaminuronic acid transferase (WecB/TagA/CpsF family)
MAGKERTVTFKSKVPTLVGEVQQKTNHFYTAIEIARMTGLERKTVYKWLNQNATLKYIDGETVRAFRQFFGETLNRRVLIDELVEEVEVKQPKQD